MSAEKRSIGVALVGAGKIGRHRARLAAEHAGVARLAIVEIDAAAAKTLAKEVGADLWSTDIEAAVGRDDIDAVVVSTHELAHTEPLLAVLRFGKPTLVEKPITLSLDDADRVLASAIDHGVDLRVGYSMRYAQRYAVAKEEIGAGKIGTLIGGLARCYDTLAVGQAILGRSPGATPVMDILTYLVDVIGWYHPGAQPVEVTARSNGSILRSKGHDVDDLTFAIVTYDDGSVFDLGTSYSLPAGYPINGMAVRIELLGTDGVLLVTEDHGDQTLYTKHGYDNAYVDQRLNLAYLGSRTSGEWAGGRMFGRVADETRAWLDHLTVGGPCHLTTAAEARTTLAVTLAIDRSAATGETISLNGEVDGG
ncbi:MAG: Gfo/Idh/MocA family protein [Acidimicrobiales bacterium]